MGTDVFALVTRWEPMVAAFRAARGLGFYWDANARQNEELEAARVAGKPASLDDIPDLLPYATERDFWGGRAFVQAGYYYGFMRRHLPPAMRDPADAFVRMLYQEDRTGSDDLSTDAGVPGDADVLYAMRPATVRSALARAAAVPWTALEEIGDQIVVPEMIDSRYVPNYTTFADHVLHQQREWLHEAAASDRGLVVIISR